MSDEKDKLKKSIQRLTEWQEKMKAAAEAAKKAAAEEKK